MRAKVKIDLPNTPGVQLFEASKCDLATVIDRYPLGIKGFVGTGGDSEFLLWDAMQSGHHNMAKKLGISIEMSVDFHTETNADWATVRPEDVILQYRPWHGKAELAGIPNMVHPKAGYAIHKWLGNRGFSYNVSIVRTQVWKRIRSA